MQSFFGQPDIGAVNIGGFLTSVDLHPMDFLGAAIGFGHGRVNHLQHHRGDVLPGAIAFNERDDRLIRHIEGIVRINGDFLAF